MNEQARQLIDVLAAVEQPIDHMKAFLDDVIVLFDQFELEIADEVIEAKADQNQLRDALKNVEVA